MSGAPGIATIGYERDTPEGFLRRLEADGVGVLCDVRRDPVSRKRGFSKRALAESCVRAGLRYEHLPHLGIAREKRRAIGTPAEREAVFDEYEAGLRADRGTLAVIRAWVESGERVALACYERDPAECHRHRLARVLEATCGPAFAPRDL